MSEWDITLGGKLQAFFGPKKAEQVAKDGVTVPMTRNTEETTDIPWAKMLGVEVSQNKPVETTDDADYMFALAGITKSDSARISADAVVIDSIDIEEIDAISPSDEVTFAYIDQHQDGTAKRVGENVAFIDEVADGDPELYEIASMMVYMA